jgi:type VI secretion system protein ImpA
MDGFGPAVCGGACVFTEGLWMSFDALLLPVSEAAPCGADLNAEMDPEFDEYYFGALGRLPSVYVQPGVVRPDGSRTPDVVFDPASVQIAQETRSIDALLKRSRDIRLLVLRAQWEALAGRIGPVAEVVAAIAALLEAYPDAVHPSAARGVSERREAINDLNQPVTMVQALHFAGLAGNTEVTLRKLRVAAGETSALGSEEGLSVAPLMDALRQPSNRKKVEETHAAVVRLLDGLGRIDRACQAHASIPFSPALQDIQKVATDILGVIQSARPDIRAAAPPPAASAPAAGQDAPPSMGSKGGPATAERDASGIVIVSHLHARRMLEACERHYSRTEPSSAALLLVTQARLLIGRPLIEALETLLPAQAGKAVVDFGPQTGFQINLERLRVLTGSLPDGAAQDSPPQDPGPDPVINDSQQASAAIHAVEAYFRRSERSSPVPLLLQRARQYLEKDFQSLVDELIPRT